MTDSGSNALASFSNLVCAALICGAAVPRGNDGAPRQTALDPATEEGAAPPM
jgi:hypothetical protein